MSPDPPRSHQRTAPARPRGNSASLVPSDPRAAEINAFFDALAEHSSLWMLTAARRRKLTPAVASALAAGWTPARLAELTGAGTVGIRNPFAVLAARLAQAQIPPSGPTRSAGRPPWCGQCDERTRLLDFDGDAPRPCPRCKIPDRSRTATGSASQSSHQPCSA